MLRVVFRRLTVEIDVVPAGIATFLILIGVGLMNYLTSQRTGLPGATAAPLTGREEAPLSEGRPVRATGQSQVGQP